MLIAFGLVYTVAIFITSAFVAVPFSSWFARQIGAIDLPGENKIHSTPTPRLGGLGILLVFVFAVSFLLLAKDLPVFTTLFTNLIVKQILIVGVLLFALAIVGILDDVYGQKAWLKFVLEGIIVAVLIRMLGIDSNLIIAFGIWFAVVGLINGYNFLDGLDGLAGSIAVMHLLALVAMFALSGHLFLAAASSTLALATLGFLKYNLPPAKMFMGDTGSMSLGFIIAAFSVILIINEQFSASAILAVTFAASLPLGDLSLTVLRRAINNKPLFGADRGHFYDQMHFRAGISKSNVTSLSALMAFIITFLSVIIFTLKFQLAIWVFLLGTIMLLLAATYFQISLRWDT